MTLPIHALLLALLPLQDAGSPRTVHAPLPAPLAPTLAEEPVGPVPGEVTRPETHGPSFVESMGAVLEREASGKYEGVRNLRERGDAHGLWVVPSRRGKVRAHSGTFAATNLWGDPRMGLGFGEPVDVAGAWIAGHAEREVWARAVRAVGYRDGVEVARTAWFDGVGAAPAWFAMDLAGVDRVELHARPSPSGAGFWALDDLTYTPRGAAGPVVVDFEDLAWRARLTGSGYRGLTWETGTGSFERDDPGAADDQDVRVVPPPRRAPGLGEPPALGAGAAAALGGSATAPETLGGFEGPALGDTGAGWLPPDTCGAIGPTHFVAVVNQNLSVYERGSGLRVVNVSLQSFFNVGGSAGDPRVAYDAHADRFVVLACDFSSGVYLAVSTTSDPTGSWFKTFVNMSQGSDAGAWPDYPTLGLDEHGYYVGAYMVGNSFLMSVFAVDKAPLVAASPSLGTVSAWRQLPWEGAIQPCVTHGSAPGEYLVSRRSPIQIRVRRIDGPLTAPTMTQVGTALVTVHSDPPPVPALGSNVPLSPVGTRLMNAVWRDGSIWCAHTIQRQNRAACRWYELDAAGATALQIGEVAGTDRDYFFPAIDVNADGDAVLACSGASGVEYAGTWVTGRLAGDPPNQMAVPALVKAGEGAYNHASSGTNRWGDYSLTNVDPLDDRTIWTIQEYAETGNRWGTWVSSHAFACRTPEVYCQTAPNSVGPGATISWSGSTGHAANDLTLVATGAPANKNGLYFYGPSQTQVPFGDGFRCVSGGIVRIGPLGATDGAGTFSRALDLTQPPFSAGGNQVTPGSTWNFQLWYRDSGGPGGTGTNLTDALSVTFCP